VTKRSTWKEVCHRAWTAARQASDAKVPLEEANTHLSDEEKSLARRYLRNLEQAKLKPGKPQG
jgi:hypothetical protein